MLIGDISSLQMTLIQSIWKCRKVDTLLKIRWEENQRGVRSLCNVEVLHGWSLVSVWRPLSWSEECFSKTKWMGVTSPQRSILERPPACTGQTERRKHVPLSHSRHQTHLHPRRIQFAVQESKINLKTKHPSHHLLKADFEAKIIKWHLYLSYSVCL